MIRPVTIGAMKLPTTCVYLLLFSQFKDEDRMQNFNMQDFIEMV